LGQLPKLALRLFTWNEFPAGPQILEALAVGSLDVGVTGDTPPVYAQAAGKPLYGNSCSNSFCCLAIAKLIELF
jgi:ABC-type nitrate/sulfonate/bicarbonate transport system substrate-binding protein